MAIRWPLLVRRTHKWLALLVGAQALLWTLTGFYMVVVHIDTIHGDHLVRAPATEVIDLAGLAPPSRIVAAAPGVSEIRLQRFFGSPAWRAESAWGSSQSGSPGQAVQMPRAVSHVAVPRRVKTRAVSAAAPASRP